MLHIIFVIGGDPVPLRGLGRHARGNGAPHIAHMHAAKEVFSNIGNIDVPVLAGGDQGVVMQRLAVDQRAIDIPGHGANGHGVSFNSRPASAG